MLDVERKPAVRETVNLPRHMFWLECGKVEATDLGFVLIFGPERRLVAQFEVHRVLQRRNLVTVVSVWPGHARPRFHLFAMLTVELRCLVPRPVLAETRGANFGVFVPPLLIRGERVNHFEPLSLPIGVLLTVEDLVSHVTTSNYGA